MGRIAFVLLVPVYFRNTLLKTAQDAVFSDNLKRQLRQKRQIETRG